jgi:hypothetical protein
VSLSDRAARRPAHAETSAATRPEGDVPQPV